MASVYIYHLDVGIEVYAWLAVADVFADKFSIDIYPNYYQSTFRYHKLGIMGEAYSRDPA